MGAPGSDIDDGFALALGLGDPELSVELVTTVNGNTHVDNATRLTLELLRRVGREEVPVVRGAERPLVRSSPSSPPDARRVDPPSAHGRSEYAALSLVERVMAEPG